LLDGWHQHIFVVAAIEDHGFAGARHDLVNTPEEVVGTFFLAWCFPAEGVYAERAGATEHTAHRAVFARCVGALQQHQQFEAPIGIKHVL